MFSRAANRADQKPKPLIRATLLRREGSPSLWPIGQDSAILTAKSYPFTQPATPATNIQSPVAPCSEHFVSVMGYPKNHQCR